MQTGAGEEELPGSGGWTHLHTTPVEAAVTATSPILVLHAVMEAKPDSRRRPAEQPEHSEEPGLHWRGGTLEKNCPPIDISWRVHGAPGVPGW